MKRAETRYKGVYDAGYEQACQDATKAVRDFLREGGELAAFPDMFGTVLAAKRFGTILEVRNLIALGGWHPISERGEPNKSA